MPTGKLRKLGESQDGSASYGHVLPKDELRLDGLLDDLKEEGSLPVYIEREGQGEYRVRVLDEPSREPTQAD